MHINFLPPYHGEKTKEEKELDMGLKNVLTLFKWRENKYFEKRIHSFAHVTIVLSMSNMGST